MKTGHLTSCDTVNTNQTKFLSWRFIINFFNINVLYKVERIRYQMVFLPPNYWQKTVFARHARKRGFFVSVKCAESGALKRRDENTLRMCKSTIHFKNKCVVKCVIFTHYTRCQVCNWTKYVLTKHCQLNFSGTKR